MAASSVRQAVPVMLADRSKSYDASPAAVLALLIHPGRWLSLLAGEVLPVAVPGEAEGRIIWTSLWPVAPEDTIVLDVGLRPAPYPGSSLRFRWDTSSPPDERGVGKVRYRLNFVFGSELRGWLV